MFHVIDYRNPANPTVTHTEVEADAQTLIEIIGSVMSLIVASADDLKALPAAVRVTLYNSLIPLSGRPVKKFATPTVAARRIWALLPTSAVTEVPHSPEPVTAASETIQETDEMAKKAKKAKKQPSKKAASSTKKSPRHAYNWPGSKKDEAEPKEKSKAAGVLKLLLRGKGATYEAIKGLYNFNAQGVYDVVWYINRKCGYTITTDDAGNIRASR